MTRSLFVILLLLLSSPAFAQDSLRRHVEFLASPECAGRDVGTPGHERARDYIAKEMEKAGLLPAGTDGWFVPVRIVRDVKPDPAAALKIGTSVLAMGAEFGIADFSDGEVFGEAVFLGYGLHAPKYDWDDLGLHDLTNRTVVAFSGGPPTVEEKIAAKDRYLLSDASKAAVAMTRGASAVIFVNSPRTHGDGTGERQDRIREVRPDFPLQGMASARITARAATRVFGQMQLDLAAYQQKLDYGRPFSVEIPLEISGVLRLERNVITGQNVIGKLGSGPLPPVVLGAHYDHLGHGGPASLYKGKPRLHPGADDNASGVAVMLEAAARLRNLQPGRPIYFAALTGEERALRGSRTLARVFADRRTTDGAMFLNLDMVGRLFENRLQIFAKPQTPLFQHVLDAATRVRLTLKLGEISAAQSDHVPFAELGFEAIGFSTGHHRDYHRPTDTVDRLDWEGLRAVADLITAILRGFVN